MIKKFLMVVILLVIVAGGGVLFFGLMLPPDWFVDRDTVIAASPEKVYSLVSDFKNWEGWSPWKAKDPQMTVTIKGKSSGVGAVQTWESPTQGSGQTEIVEVVPNLSVTCRITIHAKNFDTQFNTTFEEEKRQDGKTQLRWRSYGKEQKLLPKLMAQLMFDRYMGPDFEAGLASIKKLAETNP